MICNNDIIISCVLSQVAELENIQGDEPIEQPITSQPKNFLGGNLVFQNLNMQHSLYFVSNIVAL